MASNNVPSIMIPRVFPNITERRVHAVFRTLQLGEIDHIDFVAREGRDGAKFNMVFVHFKRWFDTEDATAALEQLRAGDEPLIIEYDTPWFWKAYLNKGTKREHKERPAPKIRFATPKLDDLTQFPEPTTKKLSINVSSPTSE